MIKPLLVGAMLLLGASSAEGALTGYRQPLWGSSLGIDTATTKYAMPMGRGSWKTAAQRFQPIAATGDLVGMCIEVDGAPGAGTDFVFTVHTGSAGGSMSATSITVTIANTATYGCDQTNTAGVTAGDRVVLEVNPSATAPASGVEAKWVIWFIPDVPGQTVWMASVQGDTSASAIRYFTVFGDTVRDSNATEAYSIVGLAGTMSAFYVEMSDVPGDASNKYDITMQDCGQYTAISCADGSATVALTTASFGNWTGSDSIDAADVVVIEIDPTGSPAVPSSIHFGVRYDMAAGAEDSFILSVPWESSLSSSARRYFAVNSEWGPTATEADVTMLGGAEVLLIDMWALMIADPGTNPDGYTFTARHDNDNDNSLSDTGCAFTITADAKTGTAGGCLEFYAHPTKSSIAVDPENTPATTTMDGAIGTAWQCRRRVKVIH